MKTISLKKIQTMPTFCSPVGLKCVSPLDEFKSNAEINAFSHKKKKLISACTFAWQLGD